MSIEILVAIIVIVQKGGTFSIDINQVLGNLVSAGDSIGHASLLRYFGERGKALNLIGGSLRQLRVCECERECNEQRQKGEKRFGHTTIMRLALDQSGWTRR